jgi:hypothetical protein
MLLRKDDTAKLPFGREHGSVSQSPIVAEGQVDDVRQRYRLNSVPESDHRARSPGGTKARYQRQNRASTSNANESVLPPISVARIRLSRLIAGQCDRSDASANGHSLFREKAVTKSQPGDGFLR